MTWRRTLSLPTAIMATVLVCSMSPIAAQDATSLNPMKKVGKAALKNFLERPLFDPSRRLPPVVMMPTAPQATASEELPPALRLLGVIHGVRDMAIVQRTGEKTTTTLRTGDRFGNWTVTVMPPVGIRMRNGHRAFDYALFSNLTVSAGPVAVGSNSIGPLDAVGMPEIISNDWGISPN